MPATVSPQRSEELLIAAGVAQRAGDARQAASLLHAALRHDPTDKFAATRLAEIEIERWEHEAAAERLHAVLRDEPNFAPALAALAQAKWLAGNPQEGLVLARRAVAIQPPNPHFRMVLAQFCIFLGEFAEAEALLATVLDNPVLEPATHARALRLRGEWLVEQSEFIAADAPYRAALTLWPDDATTHAAFGMNLLRQGRFAEGWPHYAWNRRVPFFRHGQWHDEIERRAEGRHWSGEALRGKTILLWDDQGHGDAIQFFRYLLPLRHMAPAHIVHCTLPALASLFAASAPFVEFVTAPPPGLAADFYCRTSSLPAAFSSDFVTGAQSSGPPAIPTQIPYLRASPMQPAQRPRVGLVWSGDPRHLRDQQRSIPAAEFLRLTAEPGIEFACLQNAIRPTDAAAVAACGSLQRIGETWRDFADAAAALAGIDLVITVDTALAHLAGALGKPAWILLPRVADWRWLAGRADSPWYPTARLFRAGNAGWAPVLHEVAAALRTWCKSSQRHD